MAKSKPIVELPKIQKPLADAVDALTILQNDLSGEYVQEYISCAEDIVATRLAIVKARKLLNAASRDLNRSLSRLAEEKRAELDAIEIPIISVISVPRAKN